VLKSRWDVPLRGDQSRTINHQAIGLHLPGKPFQGVGFGLDLYTPDMAVDDGNIDPGCPVGETELFENQCVCTLLSTRQQTSEGRRPQILVFQSRWHRRV